MKSVHTLHHCTTWPIIHAFIYSFIHSFNRCLLSTDVLGIVGLLQKKKKKKNQATSQVQLYHGLLLRNPFTGNSKQSSAFAAGELAVAAILLECYKCET